MEINQILRQFAKTIRKFKDNFQVSGIMVADAALYSQENLQYLENIEWLTRVPLTIKSAQKLVRKIHADTLTPSTQAGYSYREVKETYGGVEQRWLIVESQKRREADLENLERKIEKEFRVIETKLKELGEQLFACEPDAIQAAKKLFKKSRFHKLTEIKTQEVLIKDRNGSDIYHYKIQAKADIILEKVQELKNQAGRFILATNILDGAVLTSEKMLYTYKNKQQSVERCFSFLKDPMFFADSVFLKSPKRIEALGLIMALSLLVYKVAQRQIRKTLKRRGSGVKNQLGRLTDRPTLRWIFQCFQSIHIYSSRGVKQISNINEERIHILKFFPPACQRYYLLV